MNRFVSKILIGAVSVVALSSTVSITAYAATIPAVYQYSVAELRQIYPGTRDQGNYDTCWAFSAVGLAEFDLINDGIASSSIDLSELQLTYYTYHNEEDPFGGTFQDDLGSVKPYLKNGGNLDLCSRTLLQWEGLIPEADLPYTSAASVQSLDFDYAFDKDVAHLQNVYILDLHKQPQEVKTQIMKHGAAGISLYMGSLGQYDTTATYDRTGESVATYYCPQAKQSNHAVNIVGWDDNFAASNFKTSPRGNGAWLVRNSWSSNTGNHLNSYFWISYYDAGLADDAWIMDFESADNYDFNYQYDGCPSVYKAISTPVAANVFKVKGADNEQLRAVSITMNEDTNVPYTVRIYTNLSDPTKPRSGILAGSVSGKTSYAGTYTIPLKKAISLPRNTYYAVVVELQKKSAGIDVETTYRSPEFRSYAYIDYNQSFRYYNGEWEDLADFGDIHGTGNLCIKAFTDRSGANIAKVTGVRSSGVTRNSAKLTWKKVSGAKGYEIYRATSKNGTYQKIDTTKSASYRDSKLSGNRTYYYKVRAYKTINEKTIDGTLSANVKVKTKK